MADMVGPSRTLPRLSLTGSSTRIWISLSSLWLSLLAAVYRLFDVSKQVVGQMFVHGVNVLISDVGSHRTAGNACVFYFLNILVDTTLGTPPSLLYFISGH